MKRQKGAIQMKVEQAIQGIERIANHIRADHALEIGDYTQVIASHIKMLESDNKRLRTRAYNRKAKNKLYREDLKSILDYNHIEKTIPEDVIEMINQALESEEE